MFTFFYSIREVYYAFADIFCQVYACPSSRLTLCTLRVSNPELRDILPA
jgi:hypothetical protein